MSFQEELEKILTDLVKQNGAELMHERLKHPSIEKALTSIINLVDKVIGEDEYPKEHIPMRIGELVDYKAERLAKLKAGDE